MQPGGNWSSEQGSCLDVSGQHLELSALNSAQAKLKPAADESLLKYPESKRQNPKLKRITLVNKPIPEPSYV